MSPRPPGPLSGKAAEALAGALRRRVHGDVRFDEGYRALYATDGSNYRQVPIGVVVPRAVEDVVETVRLCREHEAPVLPRGGGTSLAGQCCNAAVVVDMSKYLHKVLSIDPEAQRAVVQPGCVLDDLRDQAERHHLTFAPDPATHDHNTLGGMLGNNSCGIHSIMGGRTADNVHALEILTYDGERMRVGPTSKEQLERTIAAGGRRGEIYAGLERLRDRYADLIRARYPDIPRRVSGYNLDELLPEKGFDVARALVGSEGTCAMILEAELRLVPSPPSRTLVVLGYPDIYRAGDHVPRVLEFGPVGLEGIDEQLIDYLEEKHKGRRGRRMLPDGGGWLLVELGGETREESEGRAHELIETVTHLPDGPNAKLYSDRAEQQEIWEIRESGLAATAHMLNQPDNWPGWEDAAVPPAKIGRYLRDFRALLERYDYDCSLYGHLGQGCVHVRIDFDLESRAGIERFKAFTSDAADLVVSYGGTLSGEHGDGQARADLLPKMYGSELVEGFREFKRLWDPANRMNPGKVVDAYPRDSNLRLGAGFERPKVDTVFAFREDGGSFMGAALRCVGVGNCRRIDKGVMCPSYMATREEMHSTRGRSRLLFEMVNGMTRPDAPIRQGWRSPAVHEALDLCLACKGCLGDCPVSVDMATYKAEFNYHYYKGRMRPRAAYSMGLIYWWSRLAAGAPGLANFISQTPGLRTLAKRIGGIAPARSLPRFAPCTFKDWYRRRGPRHPRGRPVVLWPDTFNNHLHPEILAAALEVLEAAGCHVIVPEPSLCCGRPLYAWGMLDSAKRLLRGIMGSLEADAYAGTPIVGLEPSCVTAFRDELAKLFPDDPRAQRLSRQTFMLGEFLAQQHDYAPPRLERRALVHGHCNHAAVIGMDGEGDVMERMGLDFELLDSGCCGMAGPFGFEADHYELSLAIGERVLLPAVRQAEADTLIVTDGYACREQIAQQTDRYPLHLAQLLLMGLREGPRGIAGDYPERGYLAQDLARYG